MENCGDYDEISQPVGDYETTIDPNDYCSTPVPPLSAYEIPMANLDYETPVSTLEKVCCVRYLITIIAYFSMVQIFVFRALIRTLKIAISTKNAKYL